MNAHATTPTPPTQGPTGVPVAFLVVGAVPGPVFDGARTGWKKGGGGL